MSLASTPAALAATWRDPPPNAAGPSWNWVGTQMVQRPSSTRAVQFMGSMVAWARYGTSYVASNVDAAPASAALASPSLLATTVGPSHRAAL